MDLYIDKENLLSLVHQIRHYPDADIVDDCLRMIKRQLRLVYNFKKEEISEHLYQLWFNTLVQGRGLKEEADTSCAPPFPKRPISNACFSNCDWKTISSTYLCTDEGAGGICGRKSILLSEKGEEIQTLCKLFWGDYSYNQQYDLTNGGFSSGWKDLEDDGHCLPCTDILLVDKYLLSDTRNFENNLFPLIRRLTHHVDAPINLVVFVERTDNYHTARPYSSSDYNHFVARLSNVREGNHNPLNVTIVVYPDNMRGGKATKKTEPHGRFLLTNYRLFESDPSFGSYFDRERKLATNGMYLTVRSLAEASCYQLVKSWITHFQNIINRIYGLPNPSDYIFGKGKSNFLKFR